MEYGIGLVRSTSFGRKRVALNNVMQVVVDGCVDDDDDASTLYNAMTPTKKQCCVRKSQNNSLLESGCVRCASDKSLLETLPQDILIRILCCVEHDDLKSLIGVSKTIKDATLIAKEWHFAYSTPKKTVGFRDDVDIEDLSELDEVEALNAPKRPRVPRSRLSKKKLADISVALFASADADNWPKRDLSMAMETEI